MEVHNLDNCGNSEANGFGKRKLKINTKSLKKEKLIIHFHCNGSRNFLPWKRRFETNWTWKA